METALTAGLIVYLVLACGLLLHLCLLAFLVGYRGRRLDEVDALAAGWRRARRDAGRVLRAGRGR